METKLLSKKSDELIIFLSGWGCDGGQFKNIACRRDLLICWDYCDMSFDFDFSPYKKVWLIGYSAGVFAAGFIKDKLPKLAAAIAVNGNPLSMDKYYGIPPQTIAKFKGLNLDNYMAFRRDFLVISEEELKLFNQCPPSRSFESCFKEFDNIELLSAKPYPVLDFDYAIISECDKIFNPQRQKEYFKGRYRLLPNAAHNVFTLHFKSFDEIIDFALGK